MTGKITNTIDQFLAEKADAVRTTARNAVFEIGKHLTEAREKCPHGKWLSWLEGEFGWSHTTADKYMSIHAAIAAGKLQPKLQFGLSISSLALLSAPSTPEKAVNEVAEQAKVGGKVAHSRVKATVDKHRGTAKPRTEEREQPDVLPTAEAPPPPATPAGHLKAPTEILEIAHRVRARDTRSEIIDLCDWVIAHARPMVAVTAPIARGPEAAERAAPFSTSRITDGRARI